MKNIRIGRLLLFAGLFVLFFIWRFPTANLMSRIFQKVNKSTGIVIVAQSSNISLLGWPGVRLERPDITVPMRTQQLNVSARDVTARVGLGSLFPPAPSVSVDISKLSGGGDAYLKFKDKKKAKSVYLQTDNVALNQFGLYALDGLMGNLTSQADVVYNQSDLSKSSGQLELKIKNIKTPPQNIPGMLVTPVLSLGTLNASITINKGYLNFNKFKFGGNGSDLTGTLTGKIKLGKSFLDSVLNIVLRINASPEFAQSSNSSSLLSYLSGYKSKDDPNSYAMLWNVSVIQVMNNQLSALPQRVN